MDWSHDHTITGAIFKQSRTFVDCRLVTKSRELDSSLASFPGPTKERRGPGIVSQATPSNLAVIRGCGLRD